ncbi:MAG: 2OG-Fe(II) oxygenase [Nitrospira sp.]|nr:2OG-Fe(II) oxygenase [Nitrospira sp.]
MKIVSGQVGSSQLSGGLEAFSFHKTPVLVIENFWSAEERSQFRQAMERANWNQLQNMTYVRQDFPNSGNWAKAEIAQPQGRLLLSRLEMPCIQQYIESFPNITRRHLGFSYYSYGAGDCLLTHDDTDQGHSTGGKPAPRRRLAPVSYFHEQWECDWGGELMIYEAIGASQDGKPELAITHCIVPKPGSLVMFTVPRFHRVCRVDQTAGHHKRLSIAGWFMTEHA